MKRRVVRFLAGPSLAVVLLARPAAATPVSDFQARLAQTVWSIQQTEAILRTVPQTSATISVPDGLASYASLLSENVTALTGAATFRELSDADRKVMADGLSAVATFLRDLASLAANRGLSGALSLGTAEQSCRSAVVQLSATPGRRR